MFASTPAAPLSPWAVVVYGFTCVAFLPGPSELSLLAYPKLSLAAVLLCSATGHGVAVLMFAAIERLTGLGKLLQHWSQPRKGLAGQASRFALRLIQRYGVWGMGAVVCTPGLPFRIPLWTVLVARSNLFAVLPIYLAALAIRTTLVWAGIGVMKAVMTH